MTNLVPVTLFFGAIWLKILQPNLWSIRIWTQGCCIRSAKSTSMLCHPCPKLPRYLFPNSPSWSQYHFFKLRLCQSSCFSSKCWFFCCQRCWEAGLHQSAETKFEGEETPEFVSFIWEFANDEHLAVECSAAHGNANSYLGKSTVLSCLVFIKCLHLE